MVSIICLSHDDPDRVFDYCPSFGAAIAAAVLFSLITFAHILLASTHRKPFCWVLIMGALWEAAGYAIRSYNITRQAESSIYTVQFLLILLAPLWINAFVYMTCGRMIHFFLAAGEDKIFSVRARRVTKTFVWCDITAFLVQLTGGMLSSGSDRPVNIVRLGLKIYTGGVGLQLAFIAIFCGIAIQFQRTLKRQDDLRSRLMAMESIEPADRGYQHQPASETPGMHHYESESSRSFITAKPLFLTIWIVLSLIIFRNIYRLVEYAMGGVDGNTITNHEWWMYVFDAVPMFAALIVFAAYHPGRILQGERCDFRAEDQLLKKQKMAKKMEKKAEKQAKKMEKKVEKQAKRDEKKGGMGMKK